MLQHQPEKMGQNQYQLGSATPAELADSPEAEGLVSTTSYSTWFDSTTFSLVPPLLFPLMIQQAGSAL